MADFYMTREGDISQAANGDIGLTETGWRDDAQQAYFRLMTEPGDFVLQPAMGVDLARLYGMPQSQSTAEYGKQLILAGLNKENAFAGKQVTVTAAPTGPQSVRFDVYVASGSRSQLIMSITQDLGVS